MKNKFVFIGLILFIILIQVVNICSGVNYDWKSIALITILILLSLVVLLVASVKKYKKLVVNFNNKNYDCIIKAAGLLFTENSEQKHYFYYMKAMSHFEKKDYDNFNLYLDKIDHKNLLLTKYYLKVVYFIMLGDDEQIKFYKGQYKECKCEDKELKAYYDKVLFLLESKEAYSDEEQEFIESIRFEQIKRIIKR